MRKTVIGFVIGLFVLTTAFRSDRDASRVTHRADYATVFIYRGGQAFALGLNYSIFVNGEKICKLSNNRYIEYKAKPGKLAITAQRGGIEVFKRETGIDLDVQAGGKYYVQGDVKSSLVRTRLELSEVTENTAKRGMQNMSPDNCQESLNKAETGK